MPFPLNYTLDLPETLFDLNTILPCQIVFATEKYI